MPKSAFGAIENSLHNLLGGARVRLLTPEELEEAQETGLSTILIRLRIGEATFCFQALRRDLPFTRTEATFCRELMAAFEGLFNGFRERDYAAHFRTALLTSLTDIAVARYMRKDSRGIFWGIQRLIQLLKNLSYQRYEGSPATTGFLVYRTALRNFQATLGPSNYSWMDLSDLRPKISQEFFRNPLTYRFVDGQQALFVCDIRMQVKGTLRMDAPDELDRVGRLVHQDTVALLKDAGKGAFAIFVNETSEIEILTDSGQILVWRKGFWAIFDPDILRAFLHGILERSSIDDLIWTVYAISKTRHGTVILITNKRLRDLDRLKTGSVGGDDPLSERLISHVRGKKVGRLKKSGELMRLLSSDGMTILHRSGKLLDTGVIVDTSHATRVVAGGGRTTAANAASHFGKVIKVSEDGPIELYENGQRLYWFG